MFEFRSIKPVVLLVEDDHHSRAFMESSLELSGLQVISTQSAEEARSYCDEYGLPSISVVLSDYRLPGQTGIEFLTWVHSIDPAISTLIITGQGEKEIVRQSITAGVFQYLEKPVTHQELREIIWKAVEQTKLQRKFLADRKNLQELEHIDKRFNVVIPRQLKRRMRVFYRPLHEVGGDFLIAHGYEQDRWILLVGDVSGHDIRSGFVSTYFQGMFRGCIESGGSTESALQLFNRSLRTESVQFFPHGEMVSLSVSCIDFGPSDDSVQHWNFGLTPCVLVSRDGAISECPIGRFPLGWMDEISTNPTPIVVNNNDLLYIFTDGLAEFANSLEVNYFSLLYRLMHTINGVNGLPAEPSDDILSICYSLNSEMSLEQSFEPILSEHYAGTEIEHIDHLQSNWRRSLSFALDDRLGDRLYDLLICIREGMLNALIHGCQRSADKFAHLQISINEQRKILRVHIDDPGKGHAFDLQERLAKINRDTGKHLGLGIIQHLSDTFQVENKGTSLIFDFTITPEGS